MAQEKENRIIPSNMALDALRPEARDYLKALLDYVQGKAGVELSGLENERQALLARINELKASIADLEANRFRDGS